MICKTKKSVERQGKVLFINAKNEITRKDTFSFLEEKHIEKIVNAYRNFEKQDDFAVVVTTKELLQNHSTLSVGFYVNKERKVQNDPSSTKELFSEWEKMSRSLNEKTSKIVNRFAKEDD